jgi:hypothetical protein
MNWEIDAESAGDAVKSIGKMLLQKAVSKYFPMVLTVSDSTGTVLEFHLDVVDGKVHIIAR